MRKKHRVWLQLAVTCLCAHTIVLALFFVTVQSRNAIQFVLRMDQKASAREAPVLLGEFTPEPEQQDQQAAEKAPTPARNLSEVAAPAPKNCEKVVTKPVAKKSTPANPEKKQAKPTEKKAAKPQQKISEKPKLNQTFRAPHPAHNKAATSTESNAAAQEILRMQVSKDTRHLVDEYEELHAMLSEQWQPPSGFAGGRACVVQFSVDWNGAIGRVEVTESSGILMFDMAARNTVTELTLPRWTRGKSVAVTFAA